MCTFKRNNQLRTRRGERLEKILSYSYDCLLHRWAPPLVPSLPFANGVLSISYFQFLFGNNWTIVKLPFAGRTIGNGLKYFNNFSLLIATEVK
jgi:hypothetical protein